MKEIFDDFCIGEETNMLMGTLGENGVWHTWVVHGGSIYIVKGKPIEIIEQCLLRNGSTYKGARKAAKFHLGNGYMLPIALHSNNGYIILFSSESPDNGTCLWFVLHNVANSIPKGRYQTDIIFTNGVTYPLMLNERKFRNKKNIAADYRDKLMRCYTTEGLGKTEVYDYSIINEMARVYSALAGSKTAASRFRE